VTSSWDDSRGLRIGVEARNDRRVESLHCDAGFRPRDEGHYITQASVRPPTFVLFTDKAKQFHFSTERFLMNQLRKRFGFVGTPIVVKAKRR